MAEYWGRLTDFAGQPFPGAIPRLSVTAEHPAVTTTGLLATKETVLPLASDGTFIAQLVPTADTSPQTRYVFLCTWFATNAAGAEIPAGWSEWTITAAIGGGPIKDMVSAPASVWFVGPPFPEKPVPGAFYLNRNGDQPWARYPG